MRRLVLLAVLALSGCGGSHARTSSPRTPITVAPVDGSEAAAFAVASNQLGVDVWNALRADRGRENLALSPASITTALAMTYAGARGDTAAVMAHTMHVEAMADVAVRAAGTLVADWNDEGRTDYELAVANRLFGAEGYVFAPAFLDLTRDAFGAELQRLDFAGDTEPSRETINDWVEVSTHDRIVDLLPSGSVDPSTQLVLVNAVYFHGQWATTFDRAATRDAPFHTPSGERSVPTMHEVGGRWAHDGDVRLLEKAYVGGELSMLFVLPDDPSGLAAIEDRVDLAQLAAWSDAVHDAPEVEVALPRFRIETGSMSLRTALVSLGMGVAFGGGADFTGMSAPGASELFVDDVVHRVFVEVNEEGTEAAAATAVIMTDEAVRETPTFVADHPFLFFLRDLRTGAILFTGRVVDPS